MAKMIYIDSNIIIYLLEGTEPFATSIASTLTKNKGPFITSSIAITEVLAGNSAITSNHLKSIPRLLFADLDTEIAAIAGEMRQKENIKTPDAIHLATAKFMNCTAIFTNDSDMIKTAKNELKIIKP